MKERKRHDSEWERAHNQGQIFLPDINGSGRDRSYRSSLEHSFLSLPLSSLSSSTYQQQKGREGQEAGSASLTEWHTSSSQVLAQLTGTVKQGVIWKVAGINTAFPREAGGKDNMFLLLRRTPVGILHALQQWENPDLWYK